MFKKSITFLVAVMLLFSCISSYAMIPYYQTEDMAESGVPYGLLEELGILSIDEYKTLDTEVTKGMFLKYIIRMSGVEDSGVPSASKRIFIDVPMDSKYAPWVEFGYNRGIIFGDEVGVSGVDSVITAEDAAVMAARAVGYNVSDSLLLRAKSNALQGVKADEMLTAESAMKIIWNTLSLNVMMENSEGFYIDGERSILEYFFKIYKYSGIIDDDAIININGGASTLKSDRISVNGITYQTKSGGWPGLAGRYADVYIREEQGESTVAYVNPVRNTVKIISVDEIDSFSNGRIKLDDEKTLKLSDSAKTILNFERAYINSGNFTLPKDGTFVMIDNNSDNAFDCIFIFDPAYGSLVEVDTRENIVYTGQQDKRIIYNLNEYERVEIYDYNGKKLALTDISAGAMIEAYAAKDKEQLFLVAQKNSVTHTISTLQMIDNNSVATVADGTKLMVSPYFDTLNAVALKPGSTYDIILDSNGRIAIATELDAGGLTYGYMFSYKEGNALDAGVNLAIYSVNGEMITAKVKDKFTIKENDAESVMTSESFLNRLKSDFTPVLIRFALNENKEISKIEYPSSDRFSSGFRCVGTTGSATSGTLLYDSRMRANVVGMIGGQILLDNAKTKIIFVPGDMSVDGNWGIMSVADVFMDSQYYQSLKGYSVNPDSMAAEVIVVPESKLIYNDGASLIPGIVAGFEERYDEKTRESYTAIRIFQDGSEVSMRVNENVVKNSSQQYEYTIESTGEKIPLEIGDVIRIVKDHNDYIIGFKLLFDASSRTCYGENDTATEHFDKGYGHKQRTNYGTPYKILGNAMYLIKEGEDTPSSDIFRTDVGTIYEFDASKKNPVRVITGNDIETLSNNTATTNKIFIQLYYSKSLITVVYK